MIGLYAADFWMNLDMFLRQRDLHLVDLGPDRAPGRRCFESPLAHGGVRRADAFPTLRRASGPARLSRLLPSGSALARRPSPFAYTTFAEAAARQGGYSENFGEQAT